MKLDNLINLTLFFLTTGFAGFIATKTSCAHNLAPKSSANQLRDVWLLGLC
jgi:hypothetical protein